METVELWGDTIEIMPGFSELAGELGLSSGSGGIRIEVCRRGAGLHVSYRNRVGKITYGGKSEFFRALGHLAAHLQDDEFEIDENSCFETLGVMADTSRNAVPTVGAIKRLLRCMALMGFNMLMMYTEDTYEIKEHPYFGYMRGAYTRNELRECDEYAFRLGIEMVPCIQTLAHMPRVLQWQCYDGISDTQDILLCGEEKTYCFIDDMISAASAPFRSDRIHIGMDEANMIGLGKYLTLYGARPRFDILCGHLDRVVDIVGQHHLRPMMWSDMFYRLVNPEGDYANVSIPREVVERIPESIKLVYWNYYSSKKNVYLRQLRQHEQMKKGTVFAGGVWTWNGMAASYSKTRITTMPALEACHEAGVREVLVTLWGDDGAETDIFQALLGLQLYAEFAYGSEDMYGETVCRRFKECTGGDPQAFLALDSVDNVRAEKDNNAAVNTSKLALYQDIMTGLFDWHFKNLDLRGYYKKLAARFSEYAMSGNRWAYLFDPVAALCEVLSVKAGIGVRITQAYRDGNRSELERLGNELDALTRSVHTLKEKYRRLWLHDFKPFGFEVLDIRLGGVIARIEYAGARLDDYLSGHVTELPELEEQRLPHNRRLNTEEDGLCRFNRWHQTVTTSYIGHNIP